MGRDRFLEGGLPGGIKEVTLWDAQGWITIEAVERLVDAAVVGVRYPEPKKVSVRPVKRYSAFMSQEMGTGKIWGWKEWVRVEEEMKARFSKAGGRFELSNTQENYSEPFPEWL